MEDESYESKIYTILKVIGVMIVILVLLVFAASQMKVSTFSQSSFDQASKSNEYLSANKTLYGKCYSNLYGSNRNTADIGLLSIAGFQNRYYNYEELKKAYFAKVEETCGSIVTDYEAEIEKLSVAETELNKPERSLLDDLLGKEEVEAPKVNNSRLSTARMGIPVLVIEPSDLESYYIVN